MEYLIDMAANQAEKMNEELGVIEAVNEFEQYLTMSGDGGMQSILEASKLPNAKKINKMHKLISSLQANENELVTRYAI